jgi:SMC interacting uncharacterized protein involved in chromosome segregation
MSEINIKVKLDFAIGEKVYYCQKIKESNSEIFEARIKNASINYNGKRTIVKYNITYRANPNQTFPPLALTDSIVSSKNLYRSKMDILDIERTNRKQKLSRKVNRFQKIVNEKEKELKKIKKELEEIKKEELVVELSGIGSKK